MSYDCFHGSAEYVRMQPVLSGYDLLLAVCNNCNVQVDVDRTYALVDDRVFVRLPEGLQELVEGEVEDL